ncbi:TraR/DksA family transcriptional regulator [Abyssibius alkaniclasticus]|uniref:TraR/DksA family transcriptional regulator n=1 Tax=Abyssibius alkaniclasticus TaxID=2881234 RepID=UPI0023642B04|nr:TraR/DksA family transcriptional regulator [Abyssibius alkaniclasticus]UPH69937.1 TraR/DksA family transcriptional regulator [Abyssibius alkaniclasticus]|tara:strand:- start:2423 stop:2740 length:318 start_codon:yes stop_codon:yes gene_type:complete
MNPHSDRRAALENRLKELNWKLVEIEDALDETPSADSEERAVEREDDEVLEGIGAASQAEIRMINAALARIESGDYGICTICGEDIAEARLDLVPHTPFCKNCAP